MLKSYIKIALRNLFRRKVYTTLNIIGLSTGLACAVFILNWVSDELSFDQFYQDKDTIYRVVAEVGTSEDRWHQTVTSMPAGPIILSTFPEVIDMVRLDYNNAIVINGDKRFTEDNILLVDTSFFGFFGYSLLEGNESTALSRPYQIVLTQSMATKYFGEDPAIGKNLRIFQYDPDGNGIDYMVTGIIADPPKNAHFSFNMLASISTMASVDPAEMDNWGNNSYYTYIKLKDGADPDVLESKFPEMINFFVGPLLERHYSYFRFYLQPIASIHLYSDILYEITPNGNIEYVWIFSIIGVFILLLAGINYVNLSTSIALERSKETGVRKVMGAVKFNIVSQHIVETTALVLFSMLFAGLLVELLKPNFQLLAGKQHLQFGIATLFFQLVALCVPIGLMAGFFPAYFLSKMDPIDALKGTIDKNSKNGLRSFLVGFQFIITLIILVGLIIVREQLDFIQSKDIGYDKQNLLTLKINGDRNITNGFEHFKNELLQSSNISSIGRASSIISSGLSNSNGRVLHPNGKMQIEKMYRLRIDHDYIPTYKMGMAAGRNFNEMITSDSNAYIVNEKAARNFGWTPEEAVGKDLKYEGVDGIIVGVVKDFHFNSLHHSIDPVCMLLPRRRFSRIIIRGENSEDLFNEVKSAFASNFPDAIFDYRFQDQALFNTYQSDYQFRTIFNIFSGLSMMIAFLGLFGLVGYSVTKRTKEIGIRKVLGASSTQILRILSIHFLVIISFASIIGLPLAGVMMNKWLGEFPYHIDLTVWHFIVASAVIFIVAMGIIIYQSITPILSNPSVTLKDE